MEPTIVCPKCGSSQLTADKKGFSGKKAFAGAVLTGGIGLLAGTIGSNKIKITCLACGNQFKPGEGNKIYSTNQNQTNIQSIPDNYYTDEVIENTTKSYIKGHGIERAIEFVREKKKLPYNEAWTYVKNIKEKYSITPKGKTSTTTNVIMVCIVVGLMILLIKACS